MKHCIPSLLCSKHRRLDKSIKTKLFPSLISHTALFIASSSIRAIATDECISYLKNPHKFYINGTWIDPHHSDSKINIHDVVDPSTGRPFATIPYGSQFDVNAAVSSAKDAFASWSIHTSPSQRLSYIERLLDIYNERSEDMAQAISKEMGAPIDMAREEHVTAGSYHMENFLNLLGNDTFHFERTIFGGGRLVAENKDKERVKEEDIEPETIIRMEPIGVVALITPWNWPMNQITLKVIPALAVGCTAVLKPSELSPISAHLFTEMVHEAGIPPGVFNLVHGDGLGVGTHLTSHPDVDMVSFTGSTRAAASISKTVAESFKKVSLELGGKGAYIVFADMVDNGDGHSKGEWESLENIVKEGVLRCFENSGQSCNAPTRMLVQRSIYEKSIKIAKSVAEEVKVKPAYHRGDHMGPVVSQSQFDVIQSYIESGINEGAQIVVGGLGAPDECCTADDEGGFYVRPTVFINCESSMQIMREEIFGPVLCITPFDSEKEALEIANDTPYGLMNYVWSADRERRRRMARELRSGVVQLNGFEDYMAPFGGTKASGNGREGGIWGLEEFCYPKAVTGWE